MEFQVSSYGRQLQRGQRSVLTVFDVNTCEKHVVFEANYLLEAPNWTPDGNTLIFNAGGQLGKISVSKNTSPELLSTGSLANLNNDHVLSPDGRSIYVSSNDNHLYKVNIATGALFRVSNIHDTPFRYYLHGVSPDEQELAYVGMEGTGDAIRTNIFTIPTSGGEDKRLTNVSQPNDGPEYSPDGSWIYFNSELNSPNAQIFRMKRDGSGLQQLTFDERVNWFPHISPDGKRLVYLSFPTGTQGHPSDKDVILRAMDPEGGETKDVVLLFGGQGTLNVNSWAPDSTRFAYVEYPIETSDQTCVN
ncbi:periplasmic component of the Tol biopolymer transport system [Cadophora sp. MPI-SDFR-AT-0126]|nr:periplasmic component of the Tol biopolymer transport system [Leotiomycetes sp. MPI-SDFR-AT-0126]